MIRSTGVDEYETGETTVLLGNALERKTTSLRRRRR